MPAHFADHVGDAEGVAAGAGEVGFGGAPEGEFFGEEVDGGIGEGGAAILDEAVEVIGVGVAEEGGGELFWADADGGEAVLEPAHAGIAAGAEAGVEEGDFLTGLDDEEVDVEGEAFEGFAVALHFAAHGVAFGGGVHEVESFAEGEVAVADGEGFEAADGEAVDEGLAEGWGERFGLGGAAEEGGPAGEGGGGEVAAGEGRGGGRLGHG